MQRNGRGVKMKFNTLFTLAINHDYYTDSCRDFDFLWSDASRRAMKRGRLLSRVSDGKLYCLYEADESDTPVSDLSGEFLLLGLRLKNPYFNNFTDVTIDSTLPLYRNASTPTTLDAATQVIPTGRLLNHQIADPVRPVTVALIDRNGQTLATENIDAANTRDEINFDLQFFGEGRYTVSETSTSGTSATPYYYDEGLYRAGVFGLVEIAVNAGFYGTAPEFEIGFNARTETLKYYIVANNYTDAEFAQLDVSDTGYAEEGRPQINFTRLSSGAFTADDIEPDLLGDSASKVTVFKSQTAVARRQTARKKLQLSRNGDVLVSDLPAPGADKVRADFVIHVAKP